MDTQGPDLGDLVIALLAGTLAGLSERLEHDGFHDAADLVRRLCDEADRWSERKTSR